MTDDRKPQLDSTAVLLLVLCCTLWGMNNVATKVALQDVPPLLQAALRSLGAALLLAAWAKARGIRIWERDGTGHAGLVAGLLFAAEFACMFSGLQFTSASRMTVFVYLSPFVVALGMPLIDRKERLSKWQAAGLTAAFAGVVWAFAEGFGDGAGQSVGGSVGGNSANATAYPRQWLGDALGITTAVLWGATTLVLRGSRLTSATPEKALLYQLAVSAAALGLASWAMGEPVPQSIRASALAAMVFQTVVITFASYLTWFWLMRHYPATRVSAFTLLAPISGLLAGALLLGEPVTLRIAVALAAVVTGMILVNRR